MKMAVLLLLLLLSLTANVFLFYKYRSESKANRQLLGLESSGNLTLINPSVGIQADTNVQSPPLILHYKGLKEQLVQEITQTTDINDVGVFLQDAKTGAWVGINEQEGFTPASLLKVPLMMALLKKVERGEIQLTDTVVLTEEDLNRESGDLYKKGVGAKLTEWELLKYMILTSDNTAKNAVKRQLLPAEINAVFVHVGIENPYSSEVSQDVTPRGYTRFFKSLYLASFLSPELSQKALDLTTDTQVESLISGGVPSDVQVAHKYGERPDGLTDCGIIYHPKSPYYLCLMTKDIDVTKAKTLISSLSKIIYTYIDNRDKDTL